MTFKKLSEPLKLLTVILIITIVTEFVSLYLEKETKVCYRLPYHFFQLIEYCLVGVIYKNQISYTVVRKYITHSIYVYPVLMILCTIFLQPLDTYPSYSLMLSYVSILVYSLIYFYEFIEKDVDFLKDKLFKLNTLYFLLSSVSIFTLSLTNVFNILKVENSIIDWLHIGINYIFYIGCLVLIVIESKILIAKNEY